MSYGDTKGKAAAYGQVSVQSEVLTTNPHRVIQLLMEGVLEKVAIAKGNMERGNKAACGSHISWAISIIDGLRMSLDQNVDHPITHNLDALYDYMARRLLTANIEQKAELLDEVSRLMRNIKEGWDGIAGVEIPKTSPALAEMK